MLLVLNGAPGVGKSTLADRYADEHALSLVIDVDAIRQQLGRWDTVEESKVVARDLAVTLARAHLERGHDVVVAQYIGRPELLEQLRSLAAEADTRFVEVVLTDDGDRIAERFRLRRADHVSGGIKHPEADLPEDAIATEVAAANERLLRDAAARDAAVISVAGGPDRSFAELLRTLGSSG